MLWRQFPFDDVEIGAAHAAGEHAQQNISGRELWLSDVSDAQRALRYWLRRGEDCGLHVSPIAGSQCVGLRPADSRGRLSPHTT